MKRLGIFIISILLLAACSNESASDEPMDNEGQEEVSTDIVTNPKTAGEEQPNAKLPVIEFETTEYDFGEVNEGDIVEYAFKFKNTGEGDLVISNAKASCGCTVPKKPEGPIKPGASDEIAVRFNSQGKSGQIRKAVTITANTNPNQTFIYITGTVNKKEE